MKCAIVMDGDIGKVKKVLNILDKKGYTWKHGASLNRKLTFNPDYILVGMDGNIIYWCTDEQYILGGYEKISADLFIDIANPQRKKLDAGTPIMIVSDTSRHGFKIGSVAIVLDDAGAGDIYAMGFVEETKDTREKYLSENDYEVIEYDE